VIYGWLFQRWFWMLKRVPDEFLSEASSVIPEMRRCIPHHLSKFQDLMLGCLFAEYLISHPKIIQNSSPETIEFFHKKRGEYYDRLGIGIQCEIDAIIGILIWKEIIQRENQTDN
jgi:hypothetical protein